MELQILIKQTQQYDKAGNQIYYQGSTVNTLSATTGTLPTARQWNPYGTYIDVTADVASDPFKTRLTWTAERDNEGYITPGVSNSKKSFSGTILLNGTAYQLIKQWLIDDVSGAYNSVDVMIRHIDGNAKECGEYINYIIKATDIQYCEDNICQFDVNLKQRDEPMNCIRSTFVYDNWQGWFQEQPAGGKKHPRFSYCNEQRPNGILVMLWYMSGVVVVPTLLFMIPLFIALNGIFAVINVIIGIIKTIIAIVGGNDPDDVDWTTIEYFDFQGIADSLGAYYVESAGCGREHTAPLVRDYITNVCDKCGIEVDHLSAPIFFAQSITFETPYGQENYTNPYYNVCYFNAPVERGLRRFASLNALRAIPNNTTYYLYDNRPLLTLDMMLDQLKEAFNAEWKVVNGKLYFQRKDWFRAADKPYVLDLSERGADRPELVQGICMEWNEQKIPAAVEGMYSLDASDKPGNEAHKQQNYVLSYGDASQNPVFDGIQDKKTVFGAAAFRLDGTREDYIMDAFQVTVNGSFLTPFLAGLMFDFVKPSFVEYADYALLLESETAVNPKLIVWDGASYENAKAIKEPSAWPILNYGMPDISTDYNGTAWNIRHAPKTFVRGSGLTLPPNQPGYYLVTDFFGAREYKQPALLVNYPMYFEPQFRGNMWDRFHWIDDPRQRGLPIRSFNLKLQLCCELLKRLQVFGDGSAIVLGEKIALPNGRDGVITEISVSYDPTDTYGQWVEIKGNVYG